MTIRTLMDNTAGLPGTTAEHGLSFWVEHAGNAALFDTGKTGGFLDNARALGVDPGKADAVVLSHGHYDHGGGLRALTETGGFRGDLWTGPGFFDPKWSDEAPAPRFLGVDFDAAYLAERGIRHRTVAAGAAAAASAAGAPVQILPGLFAVAGFEPAYPLEGRNPRFVVDRDGRRTVDDFRDETCLVVDLGERIAVILGCAHPGIMTMLSAVQSRFDKPLAAVFGGSHLVEADDERLDATIEYLRASGCPLVALGHCTGERGSAALASALPSYRALCTGVRFSV